MEELQLYSLCVLVKDREIVYLWNVLVVEYRETIDFYD